MSNVIRIHPQHKKCLDLLTKAESTGLTKENLLNMGVSKETTLELLILKYIRLLRYDHLNTHNERYFITKSGGSYLSTLRSTL